MKLEKFGTIKIKQNSISLSLTNYMRKKKAKHEYKCIDS
jgi:hypothetical protein